MGSTVRSCSFVRRHYTKVVGLPGKAPARTSREYLRKTPGIEVEVKLPVTDRKALLRLLKKLKANGGKRMHEMNTLYDTPGGTLAQEGKLVRIRVLSLGVSFRKGNPGRTALRQTAVLTYKGPAQAERDARGVQSPQYKIRQEHELRVEDGDALARVFDGMGLRPCFRYEKYRTSYRLPGVAELLVELDETPLGDFLELEGAPAAIDSGAAILGYPPTDYITKSYGQLFMEQSRPAARAGASPGDPPLAADSADMLFPRRK
jgi:adenylate cyclase class 2